MSMATRSMIGNDMMNDNKKPASHDTLREMDKHDAEQPGEVKPSQPAGDTEAAPREDD